MYYYQKLLIVSDNKFLCLEFKKILENQGIFDHCQVSFKHSPRSPKGLLSDITGSNKVEEDILDLKDESQVSWIIEHHDLVFSVHCKQLFPDLLCNSIKCLNIHPGYNPINRGWFPQVFAIINNLPLGATIHEITPELDNGPIIARELVPLYEWDTSNTAYDRVVNKEIQLLNNNIIDIISNNYNVVVSDEPGNLFLKKDFNSLCEVDLDKTATYREVIDHLRALTHHPYSNAYFYSNDGKKITISLNITTEDI